MSNWLDVALIGIFAVSVISGLAKGFARIVLGTVGTLLGIVLAIWFYGVAGSFFEPYMASKSISNFIGFILILAAVSAVGSLAGRFIAFAAKKVGLGWLDRLLGGGLGFARATLVAVALIAGLVAFSHTPPPKSVTDSALAPYVIEASKVLVAIAPRELRDSFFMSYEKIQERWGKVIREGQKKMESQVQ